MADHFSKLRRGKHRADRLQKDFDIFGAGAFTVEILATNVHPDEESEFIKEYQVTNPEFGYNKAPSDHELPGIACRWNEKEYISICAAARDNNIREWSLGQWIKKGFCYDADVPQTTLQRQRREIQEEKKQRMSFVKSLLGKGKQSDNES